MGFQAGNVKPSREPALLNQIAVFGSDNRTKLARSQRQLKNKIGSLYETRSHSVCTAFCVGRDLIATASHCLFRTSGETAPKLSGFVFQLDGPQVRGVSRIAGVDKGLGALNVISGSTRLSVTPPIEATRDWAFAKLAEPVCTAGGLDVAPMSTPQLTALAEAGQIYHVAYHRDLPKWELAQGGPCGIRNGDNAEERASIARDFDDTRDLILHTCDTGGASSGSPLLADGPDGPEVVAINVGTYVRSKVLMQNGAIVHRYKSDSISNTAVAGNAFAGALAAFAGARILNSRADILLLQDGLRIQGYYAGSRDGVYGPVLRAGIEKFERNQKRPVLGLASADLLLSLKQAVAAKAPHPGEVHAIETGSIDRSSATKAKEPVRK